MLTGDNEVIAAKISDKIGIYFYKAEAIKVARKTHQIVWQNIIFALRVIKK
jgi:cation transport ATPase